LICGVIAVFLGVLFVVLAKQIRFFADVLLLATADGRATIHDDDRARLSAVMAASSWTVAMGVCWVFAPWPRWASFQLGVFGFPAFAYVGVGMAMPRGVKAFGVAAFGAASLLFLSLWVWAIHAVPSQHVLGHSLSASDLAVFPILMLIPAVRRMVVKGW